MQEAIENSSIPQYRRILEVPADPRKIPYRVILSKDPQPGPILSQQPHGSNNGNKDNTNGKISKTRPY